MNRNEFLSFLARQVFLGAIDMATARFLAGNYDFYRVSLPLPPKQVASPVTRDEQDFWFFMLLALLTRNGFGLSNATSQQKRKIANFLQDYFAKEVTEIANDSLTSITEWERNLVEVVKRQYFWMGQLSTERSLNGPEIAFINDWLVNRENAPLVALAAYGESAALRTIMGSAYSPEYHSNRSLLYAGSALALFYALENERYTGQDGWIARYISRDDNRTCVACSASEADGPYLIEKVPLPGEICFGRGKCRCEIVYEFNPDMYNRLIGEG